MQPEKWITNGRTVYTTVTDARSRHPEQRQAVLSIAEGWSDKEAAELCERIVALPELLWACERMWTLLDAGQGRFTIEEQNRVRAALVAAKGGNHAAPAPTD